MPRAALPLYTFTRKVAKNSITFITIFVHFPAARVAGAFDIKYIPITRIVNYHRLTPPGSLCIIRNFFVE
jgi:hypothetical protein